MQQRMEGIGALLRDVRLARGLDQYELAHRTGLTRATLIAIEKGRTDPKLTTFLRIADALGLTLRIEGET